MHHYSRTSIWCGSSQNRSFLPDVCVAQAAKGLSDSRDAEKGALKPLHKTAKVTLIYLVRVSKNSIYLARKWTRSIHYLRSITSRNVKLTGFVTESELANYYESPKYACKDRPPGQALECCEWRDINKKLHEKFSGVTATFDVFESAIDHSAISIIRNPRFEEVGSLSGGVDSSVFLSLSAYNSQISWADATCRLRIPVQAHTGKSCRHVPKSFSAIARISFCI